MELLSLDDPRIAKYRGGYKDIVNILPFLDKLRAGEIVESDWEFLWDDLHHQGDVGEASYAIIPYLVEYASAAKVIPWHVFGFTAAVELVRIENNNPPVPSELEHSYQEAIETLPRVGHERVESWGDDVFEPFMACLALSLGRRTHARAYLDMSEREIARFYEYFELA